MKDDFRALLMKLGAGKYEGNQLKVTVFEKSTPPRLDVKKLTSAMPQLDLTPFITMSTSLQLRVTRKGDDESKEPSSDAPVHEQE